MTDTKLRGLRLWLAVALMAPAAVLSASNWPEWRGPARTGVSDEKNLPEIEPARSRAQVEEGHPA